MIKLSLILGLFLVEKSISVSLPLGLTHRLKRSAEEAKTDLAPAETRIDPYLYDRPGFIPPPVVEGGVYNHVGPGYGSHFLILYFLLIPET